MAGSRTRRRGKEEEPSVEDLLAPAIPGLRSSRVLEAVQRLTGVQELLADVRSVVLDAAVDGVTEARGDRDGAVTRT